MPVAVTLRLDPAIAARVERVWWAIAQRTGDHSVLAHGYPPHITLAAVLDETFAAEVEETTVSKASSWRALALTLAGFGLFPGDPPVVWAAPVTTADLLARHRAVHDSLAGLPIHPHYRPGAWVPHVTLSQRAPSAAQTIEAALSAWDGPLVGWLDRIEVVSFPPAVILRSEVLFPNA